MGDATRPARTPDATQCYLVGGGIASLAAAIHLCHDAHVPARNIHIIEASPMPGGSMGSAGDWKKGYVVRAARKLNFSYHCLYDTLSKVPSANRGVPSATAWPSDEAPSLKDDIDAFNSLTQSKDRCRARLVATCPDGPEILDTSSIGLSTQDRLDLLRVVLESEGNMGDGEIQGHFQPGFFDTKFWDMWSSMYGFQPWHSAAEFRRYLHRFLHEFPRISNLSGIERTPMNDYQSVIVPIETYLKSLGVEFQYNTKVTSISFLPESDIVVSEIHFDNHGSKGSFNVRPSDVVLVTLGSMVSSSKVGSNDSSPPPLPTQDAVLKNPDPVWKFWTDLANPDANPHAGAFGRPQSFYNRISKSAWLSFTVTSINIEFLRCLRDWSGASDGGCPLITFRDSPWMLSITLPQQPYFFNQPDGVYVFWGNGLYPDQEGMFVKKPMTECTGQELLTELLHHLNFPLQPMLEKSTTVPCLMPFIGSPFLTRRTGDRPRVIPDGSQNLGLLGQFVELDRDVTFTMEYSVRAAQTAVYTLMGLDKQPHPVHQGDHSVQVLGEALMTIMS